MVILSYIQELLTGLNTLKCLVVQFSGVDISVRGSMIEQY